MPSRVRPVIRLGFSRFGVASRREWQSDRSRTSTYCEEPMSNGSESSSERIQPTTAHAFIQPLKVRVKPSHLSTVHFHQPPQAPVQPARGDGGLEASAEVPAPTVRAVMHPARPVVLPQGRVAERVLRRDFVNTMPVAVLPQLARVHRGVLGDILTAEARVVSREDVDVPIAPSKEVTGDVLYDAPDGGAAFFLPRYEVAERVLGGVAHLHVSIRGTESGGEVEIELVPRPPEGLEGAATARPMPVDVGVRLGYRAGSLWEEETFERVEELEGGRIRAVLEIENAAQRAQLVSALQDGDREPTLRIDRTCRVAVPEQGPAPGVEAKRKAVEEAKNRLKVSESRLRRLQKRRRRHEQQGDVPGRQDCIGYDPRALSLTKRGNDWVLTSGRSSMKVFASRADAQKGLAVARRHTRQCFIGRGNERPDRRRYIFEYWEGDSSIESAVPGGEDCISYDPDTLSIEHRRGVGWVLKSDRSSMAVFDTREDARQGLAVARRHTRQCFIGRGNDRSDRQRYIMNYFSGDAASDVRQQIDQRIQQVRKQVERVKAGLKEAQRALRSASEAPRYRIVSRTLEQVVQPSPFTIPEGTPGAYQGIQGELRGDVSFTSHAVEWKGKQHHYYENPAQPGVYRYLPDAFRFARLPLDEGVYRPTLRVSVSPGEGVGSTTATVDLHFRPFVDIERLQHAAERLSTDGTEARFEPLQSSEEPTVEVRYPGSDGFEVRERASVHLIEGLDDTLTLPLDRFTTLYNGFMQASPALTGRVRVQLDAEEDAIPIEASLSDAIGDVFRYSDEVVDGGALAVQLQNAIESPVVLSAAPAVQVYSENQDRGPAIPGQVEQMAVDETEVTGFPMDVAPGAVVHLRVRATGDAVPPAETIDAMIDWTALQVVPDADAIWETVLDAAVPAQYRRTITVQTFPEVLGGSEEAPGSIIVEFLDAHDRPVASAVLSEEDLEDGASTIQTAVELTLPVRDYVMASSEGRAAEAALRYRVRTPDGGAGPVQQESAGKSRVVIFGNHLPGA